MKKDDDLLFVGYQITFEPPIEKIYINKKTNKLVFIPTYEKHWYKGEQNEKNN